MTKSVLVGDPPNGPALHLIDIENLCGGKLSSNRCSEIWDHYLHQVGVSVEDQITVAASKHHAAHAFFALPPTARRLLVSNAPDAADHALLEAVRLDRLTNHHRSVIIASGDGAFAPLARLLRDGGLRVTQVVTDGVSISSELYRSCEDLIRLPALVRVDVTNTTPPPAQAPAAASSNPRSRIACKATRPPEPHRNLPTRSHPQQAELEQRPQMVDAGPRSCGKMPVSSLPRTLGRR